jgi:hypothetical protein
MRQIHILKTCLFINALFLSSMAKGGVELSIPSTLPIQPDASIIRIQPIEDREPPSTPRGVSAKSGTAVDLTWDPSSDGVTGLIGYVVYRDGQRLSQVEGSSFKDTGVKGGETHRYQVSALDGVGNESALSAPVVVRTVDSPPGLKEAYCYPNPAVRGAAPVIHAEGVRLDSLEVKIFDVSGHLVEKGTLTPRGAGAGESTVYEFEWAGPIASGVYFGLVQGKSNDASFRSHLKIAVIR